MRLGEAVAHQLALRGVDTVFGIPGVHTIEMYRGLPAAGIASHPARHEQGAGFMADAYARQTGEVGVALLVTGPGLLNALTPLAQAWHDSVPVLFLAADTATADLGRGRGPLHDVRDQVMAASGVTAHAWRLTDAADLPALLDAAWRALRAPRPRPVVISLPIDLLAADVSDALAAAAPAPLPALAAPDQETVEQAAAALRTASAPVILCGGGARGATAQVRRLAELLDAPVITTGNGAGVLPGDHPLSVGPLLPLEGGHALVRDADVVLAVGTEFSGADMLYSGRTVEMTGTLVRIDTDPANLHTPLAADIALCADAALTLDALVAALPVRSPATGDTGAARAAAAVAASDWTDQSLAHLPWVTAIGRAMPSNAVQVLDSTQLAYTLHQVVTPDEPTARIAPYGLGTLGPALPMGIGAAIAEPERPVLVIAGDGGALFTLTELAGAVDLGRQFTLLIWDNRGYGEIRDSFDRAGAQRIDTEVTAFDHVLIARGFGAEAVGVETPEALERELFAAMRRDIATVIVARGF
ncbi:thiamine pyrophosphate-binding protein [Microbacterium sp. zg-YB36]|uniref:thiamine pyrophosphate-binding protein n=1 Tax=Microbacterium sp. zg-YB36 TaxID=2969407 RepID=UPI00214A9C03|nr:thiamine pyrophosphate-binding protein [Microbacterium sp. zg-YB36]MDL5351612.1 thiamine pyrophosphate-binding protein [Microbacterium sp. zg-YB36]